MLDVFEKVWNMLSPAQREPVIVEFFKNGFINSQSAEGRKIKHILMGGYNQDKIGAVLGHTLREVLVKTWISMTLAGFEEGADIFNQNLARRFVAVAGS